MTSHLEGSRFLITGGAGFIGSHLVEHLVNAGAQVRVLDNFSTGRRENLAPFGDAVDLIEGSVTDSETCRTACAGVDFVLHQAALPSVQRSVADPIHTHAVSASGTLKMLLGARDAGVKRFVYAASSSAYGDTPVLPKAEEMPTNPRSPYAAAKLMGEHYTRLFPHVYDLETVVLRYFNIFGPRQDPTSQYSAVIPLFITQALEGQPPTIDGDGEQTRDFTYVENVVNANLLACTSEGPGVVGDVFNVGCGDRISVNTLWKEIREATGADVESVYGPPRPGDVKDSLASVAKIREGLGYEVKVPLAEGLRSAVDHFRNQDG